MLQTSLPVIRSCTQNDLDAILDVFLRSVREVACADYNQAQIDAWTNIDRGTWITRRMTRPTWVATIDNTIAGFDLAPDGHLDMMFVHPAYQRHGVARALVRKVEDEARLLNMQRVYLEASITACPFFKRQGFHVIAEETVSRNGQDFLRYRMEKHFDD